MRTEGGEIDEDDQTKGRLDEGQVFGIMLLAEGELEELLEALDDVIREPIPVQDRDGVVLIRGEARIRHLAQVIRQGFALVG